MAVALINSNLLPNVGFITQKVGGTFYNSYVEPSGGGSSPFGYLPTVSGENIFQEPNRPSWATTGTAIDNTGVLVFDSEVFGSSLADLQLINMGPAAVYVNINTEISATGTGWPLASGEILTLYESVHDVVATTLAGVATIKGRGMPRVLLDTI